METLSASTFGVGFVLRKNRPFDGYYLIYMRVTLDGERTEIGVKAQTKKEQWNGEKGLPNDSGKECKELTEYLEGERSKLYHYHREYKKLDVQATIQLLRNSYIKGELVKPEEIDEDAAPLVDPVSFIEAFKKHNDMMEGVLKPGTLKNYKSTLRYITAFSRVHFAKRGGDTMLDKLTPDVIHHLENYIRNNPLKVYDRCEGNGLMKHMERVKKVLGWSCSLGWIERSPFALYRLKFKYVEREFLTETELFNLEAFDFQNPSLAFVRDMFVFSCYTGLAYADMIKLAADTIDKDLKGRYWIYTTRQKTEVRVDCPMLRTAAAIYEKYRDHPLSLARGTVFPYRSNKEINDLLKMIAEIVGIKKHLTYHLARHTFATTIALMNDLPIETLQKVMGIKKLSTVMIYVHVMQKKVTDDMDKLDARLYGSKTIHGVMKDDQLKDNEAKTMEDNSMPAIAVA